MSVARYLEKLLDGAEVQWKQLGDVAEYSKTRINSNQLDEYNYVGVDNLLQNRGGKVDSSYVPSSGNLTQYKQGDILIGNIRPYLRKIWLADRTGGTNGDVLVIRSTNQALDSRFLFQVLMDENFFEYNIKHSRGAKMPRGSKPLILQYPVPIPCPNDPKKSLAIQAEIVRRLGTFAELIAELTAELTARKKQYNYYYDQSLALDDAEFEWKALGSLATITIGEFVHKSKQNSSADYPVYNGGTSYTGFYSAFNNTGNKIIISARGANAGYVNRITTPYWAGNSCYSIGIKNKGEVNWKFIYYFLKGSESALIGSQQKGGIPAISKKQMEEFNIPIPYPNNPKKSLAEQDRIVGILDTFDTLTTSLTDGLPHLIELREKQYAYYRDQLLNFPKSEKAAA